MTPLRVGEQLAIAPDRTCRPTLTRSQIPQPGGPGIPLPARRILMLSWEYPPVLVGGLGRHVH
ncbi:glycosyltransferase family 1 protein, partial [Micromonospora sp. NPDC053811]